MKKRNIRGKITQAEKNAGADLGEAPLGNRGGQIRTLEFAQRRTKTPPHPASQSKMGGGGCGGRKQAGRPSAECDVSMGEPHLGRPEQPRSQPLTDKRPGRQDVPLGASDRCWSYINAA